MEAGPSSSSLIEADDVHDDEEVTADSTCVFKLNRVHSWVQYNQTQIVTSTWLKYVRLDTQKFPSPHHHSIDRVFRWTSRVSLTYPSRPSIHSSPVVVNTCGPETQRLMDGWVFSIAVDRTWFTSNWFIIWRNDRVICLTIDLLFINVTLYVFIILTGTHLWPIPSSCSFAASYSSSDCVGTGTGIRQGSSWSPSLSRPVIACCCGKCHASCLGWWWCCCCRA